MTVVNEAPTAPGRTWNGRQIWVLALLFIVVTSNYVDRSILPILQEVVKHDLQLTDWQLGLVAGPSFGIFYALAGLPSARWAERTNRAHVLPIILTVWSSMTALCGAAQNFFMLGLARAGVGLGEGGCIPISHSLVSDYFPVRQRGLAISILSASASAGGFIAASVGSIVAQTWGWRVAFAAVGVPGLLLAVLVRFTLKDPRADQPKSEAKRSGFLADVGFLLKNPTFVLVFLANASCSLGNAGILMFTGSYFIRTYQLKLVQVGAIYAACLGVAGLCGSLLSGVISDRFAGQRGRSYVLTPAIGVGLASLLFAAAFTAPAWPLAVAVLLPAYVCLDMKQPSLAAVQGLAPPHMRATAAALMFLGITCCGTGFGPPVVGAISDLVASQHLPAQLGALAHACPGGRAPHGAAQPVVTACRTALASGVRAGLLTACGFFAVSAALFLTAATRINLKLDDKTLHAD